MAELVAPSDRILACSADYRNIQQETTRAVQTGLENVEFDPFWA